MNLRKSTIIKEGEEARSKSPMIFGNCDYIAREFSKQLMHKYNI